METRGRFGSLVVTGIVVIRGIPKEGWKLRIWWLFRARAVPHVVIRGIPKEGWKLAVGIGVPVGTVVSGDQRNP